MIIQTEPFKKYENLIDKFILSTSRTYQSIYLNFEDSHAYFFSQDLFGRLKFNFSGDKEKNVFVDTVTFLTLCKQYGSLNFEDNTFSIEDEIFKIPSYEEDVDIPTFDYTTYKQNTINSALIKSIEVANEFMGKNEPHSNQAGILIYEKRIVATDSFRVFSEIQDTDFPDTYISAFTLKSLIEAAKTSIVNIYSKTDSKFMYIIVGDKEFEIMSPEVRDLRIPKLTDSFIEKFDHETIVTVNKKDLEEKLKFLKPFVEKVTNQKMTFAIEEGQVNIKVTEDIVANRIVSMKTCSEELIGYEFGFMRDLFEKAVSKIDDEFISIQIDPNKPVMNIIGETNKKRNVALSKLA